MPGIANEPPRWRTYEAVDAAGQPLGHVEDVYVDDETGEPVFLLIRGGLFGHRLHFVPVKGATIDDQGRVRVAWTADVIKEAPSVSADEHLEPDEERRLFDHYGMTYQQAAHGGLVLRRYIYVEVER